jgi:membrane protein implicated in regulation of membrane protease activity
VRKVMLEETVEEITGYRHRIEVDSRIITVETNTPLVDGERVEITRRTTYTLR